MAPIDELRDADAAAGAGNVDDLHAARHARGHQRLLHRARGLVPATARGRRRHQLELELLGEGGRGCREGQRDGCADKARGKFEHGGILQGSCGRR
ncbi:hypothetical protein ABIF65_001220 [Bradyrhizobium japonicum]